MASYRVLPAFLGNVSRRFSTPVAASVVVGVLMLALAVVYLLVTSVQSVFTDVVSVAGLLFAIFYVLTALATVVYFRRRVVSSAWDFVVLGVLPVGAIAFLVWMFVKSVLGEVAALNWSLVGVVASGLLVMLAMRVFLRAPFFQTAREMDEPSRVTAATDAAG
jgi:amino acid transporter